MKQTEFQKCALCGQGVMHSSQITFYRVSIEHMVVNVGAVRRQAGLEMMLGSPMLAHAMGAQEDMAKAVSPPCTVLVCQECGITQERPVASLYEAAQSPDTPEAA